ncbi:hypothetical protein Pmani_017973 [Petrolisthes manimaculis]|uniref:Uncharacterized protein n=1 Tax=Petrolisthes manimaculis TaxID=1843537 RepID=A0AAE1PL48_9EUCA|nr:hypothetical protein Pmani_017973 [Petrolisthes manimaculis]
MVKSIRFAYDKAIVCNSETGLHEMVNSLNRTAEEYEMKNHAKFGAVRSTLAIAVYPATRTPRAERHVPLPVLPKTSGYYRYPDSKS